MRASRSRALKNEEIMEVARFIPQERSQERFAEQTVGFSVPQQGGQRHSSCHRSRGKIAVACQTLLQERIHELIVVPGFPRRAVVGSGKRVNLAVTLGRSCRKRRWHGHAKRRMFPQAVPQDETLKERQAEVNIRRNS